MYGAKWFKHNCSNTSACDVQLIARLLKTKDAGHKNAVEEYIIQDLKLLSDFDIHKTCETYRVRHTWLFCFMFQFHHANI